MREKIKKDLIALGMNRHELAKRLNRKYGMAKPTLYRWLSGHPIYSDGLIRILGEIEFLKKERKL